MSVARPGGESAVQPSVNRQSQCRDRLPFGAVTRAQPKLFHTASFEQRRHENLHPATVILCGSPRATSANRSGLYPSAKTEDCAIERLIPILILTALTAISIVAPASVAYAACGDRPGTPTDVSAVAVSSSSIMFRWRDTTRPGEIPLGPFYDIEVTDSRGNPLGRSVTGQGNLFGGKLFERLPFNTTFCFRVRARTEPGTQGCVSLRFSARVCATTPFPQFTQPPLPFGPDTCKQGFVWREASRSDHVCVTPRSRDVAAQENRMAPSRRNPRGGPFGPNTCLQGFVWREAFAGDQVCVIPQRRSETQRENALGPSRRVRP